MEGSVRDCAIMPNCPHCGPDVEGGMKFCPNCGQDQSIAIPQDQRIPTEDVPVPPPPPPSGGQGRGLLGAKLSTVIMTVVMGGLRAAIWVLALLWFFWIAVFFVDR